MAQTKRARCAHGARPERRSGANRMARGAWRGRRADGSEVQLTVGRDKAGLRGVGARSRDGARPVADAETAAPGSAVEEALRLGMARNRAEQSRAEVGRWEAKPAVAAWLCQPWHWRRGKNGEDATSSRVEEDKVRWWPAIARAWAPHDFELNRFSPTPNIKI
jgi:hypothetical protein